MIVEEAPVINGEIENLLDVRVVAVHGESERAILVLHGILLPRGRTHVLDQRNGALDVLNVFDLEADLRSRFRPTRLAAKIPRERRTGRTSIGARYASDQMAVLRVPRGPGGLTVGRWPRR